MKFGNLELQSNLFLSPMAGYTNLPFRLCIRKLGGLSLATTDLVSARGLLEAIKRKDRGAAKTREQSLDLIQTAPEDKPLGVQLFGGVASELRDAAQWLEQNGYDLIDINMGCPVDKVVKSGAGSALMNDGELTAELIKTIVDAVKIPVTVKMRLGWDDEHISAPTLAPMLEELGVAGIAVHGRTREQGFKGKVSLEGIRRVVESVKRIPVIGNGDVNSPESAKNMIDQTGCAGVMVGRAALVNPWFFAETRSYLDTGSLPPPPTREQRIAFMTEHFDRAVEFYGEHTACLAFRKVMGWYAEVIKPTSEFMARMNKLSSAAQFHALTSELKAECVG
jgi:nifR3 family TIM-barrel protein